MKSCEVSISEIKKDPILNLSANYWCDKKNKSKGGSKSGSKPK